LSKDLPGRGAGDDELERETELNPAIKIERVAEYLLLPIVLPILTVCTTRGQGAGGSLRPPGQGRGRQGAGGSLRPLAGDEGDGVWDRAAPHRPRSQQYSIVCPARHGHR